MFFCEVIIGGGVLKCFLVKFSVFLYAIELDEHKHKLSRNIVTNVVIVRIFHYFGKFSGISNFQMQFVENHFDAKVKQIKGRFRRTAG